MSTAGKFYPEPTDALFLKVKERFSIDPTRQLCHVRLMAVVAFLWSKRNGAGFDSISSELGRYDRTFPDNNEAIFGLLQTIDDGLKAIPDLGVTLEYEGGVRRWAKLCIPAGA